MATWTPSSRVEIVQACNIARNLIRGGSMSHETPELDEAADYVLACLSGIIRCVRAGSTEVARSMRMLRHSPEGRQAQGSEADVLAVIARAANPYLTGARDRAPTVSQDAPGPALTIVR